MPTMTAGRPADADEIRSYDDIVTTHRELTRKVASGTGATFTYSEAARRVFRLAHLYKKPAALTEEMRTTAETALAAIRRATRSGESPVQFAAADTWLNQLSLLVFRPTSSR